MCEQHSRKEKNMESWRLIYREKLSHHSADASAALLLLFNAPTPMHGIVVFAVLVQNLSF
jgi:hypothetical protein